MIKLNLGRNCLKVIIRTYGIKEIFIPYYSCETIWHATREENCEVKFYHINKNFMPEKEFKKDDFILYINYFGVFENNIKTLAQKYKNLIIDNTQAFYSEQTGLAGFNSLRKFFPVQNGGYLWGVNELPGNYPPDELELKTSDFQENYEQFKKNELILNNEKIKIISPKVEEFMKNFDFEKDKKLRQELYKKYSVVFDKFNIINLPELKNNIPFCYPFYTKSEKIIQKFAQNNIKILKLWKEFPKNFPEYEFLNNVGAFPLDNKNLANRIIELGEKING